MALQDVKVICTSLDKSLHVGSSGYTQEKTATRAYNYNILRDAYPELTAWHFFQNAWSVDPIGRYEDPRTRLHKSKQFV